LFGTSQRQNDVGARVTFVFAESTTANLFGNTRVSARPLHDRIHRELVSAHYELLFVAMCVLIALLVVVENGYN
jgi:hypothetical protein